MERLCAVIQSRCDAYEKTGNENTSENESNESSEKDLTRFTPIVQAFSTYSLGIPVDEFGMKHPKAGVFPIICKLNHSCEPNAVSVYDTETKK